MKKTFMKSTLIEEGRIGERSLPSLAEVRIDGSADVEVKKYAFRNEPVRYGLNFIETGEDGMRHLISVTISARQFRALRSIFREKETTR